MEVLERVHNLDDLLLAAKEFINFQKKPMTTGDRILASRLGKKIVLGINEFYKITKDPKLMDVMKAVTIKKRSIDKRLRGRLGGL